MPQSKSLLVGVLCCYLITGGAVSGLVAAKPTSRPTTTPTKPAKHTKPKKPKKHTKPAPPKKPTKSTKRPSTKKRSLDDALPAALQALHKGRLSSCIRERIRPGGHFPKGMDKNPNHSGAGAFVEDVARQVALPYAIRRFAAKAFYLSYLTRRGRVGLAGVMFAKAEHISSFKKLLRQVMKSRKSKRVKYFHTPKSLFLLWSSKKAQGSCFRYMTRQLDAISRPLTHTYVTRTKISRATPQGKIIKMAQGLQYILLHKGKGPRPKRGQRASVHYTGWLQQGKDPKGKPIKGTMFDSSRKRGYPFHFSVGRGQVIRGWDMALADMRVGERRLLIIPPRLGYGARGAGKSIPGNATLLFDVELLKLQ